MNISLSVKEVESLKQNGLIKTLLTKIKLEPLFDYIYRRGERLLLLRKDKNVPVVLIGGKERRFYIYGWCYPNQLRHEFFYNEQNDNWLVPKWTLNDISDLPNKNNWIKPIRRSF